MKQLLKNGLLFWAGLQPLAACAQDLRLGVHESTTLKVPGAIAVFAVDADIVETSAQGNRVVLRGRRAGQTQVTVVTPAGVESFPVRVDAAALAAAGVEASGGAASGSAELGYDSGTRRYSAGLDLPFGDATRNGRLQLFGVREPTGAGEAGWALPSASLELRTPGRRLVLLDEQVGASPLTLDHVVLRGAHLETGPLELHAGIASATPWSDLLLPDNGERAATASYRFDSGPVQLVPRLLWLPDADTAVPGVLALGLERGGLQDPFRVKAELGWSGKPGASLDLDFNNQERQVWLQAATRPGGFAVLDVARPAGAYLDGAWSEALGPRAGATLTLSASRLDLEQRQPEAAAARLELRRQAGEHWSFSSAAGSSRYRDGEAADLRRHTATLGAAYDLPGFGIAALYRYQATAGAAEAGQGGRLSLRGSHGPWRADLFVDAQQQAPTLDLILQDRPDLARAFAELGLSADSPEELLRLLRDNAALLAERGVGLGELRLNPLRLQGGLNLAWREPGARRTELGLRLLGDDAPGAASEHRTWLGSVYGRWPLGRHTELETSYTRWSAVREGSPADSRDAFQLTLRTRFAAAALPGSSHRPVSGRVLRDDPDAGTASEATRPLAGVEVVLDGSRRTRSDAEGRFRFADAGAGEHQVQVVLPATPGAYFTRPSTQRLPAGGEAEFAIAFSAARLSGTVLSDAGQPLAGVTLRLQGASDATTVTDSSGSFRFAGPTGVAQVEVVAESVPPGYELAGLRPQPLLLDKGRPATASFRLRAQRVLAGVVHGGGGRPLMVTVVETGQWVNPDADGHFLMRGLPAGPVTLVVEAGKASTRRTVDMPVGPGTVADMELQAPGKDSRGP